ncbi:hypothetical protein KHP62_06540 [Rhodobacteraceae bacterium NNCM2]|nr:hypothetical protein [Coraliihabitans acroporae]
MAANDHATDREQPARAGRAQRGELMRHIVLPADNLQSAIDQHLGENGTALDAATLHLLAATRDILGDISRKGTDIAGHCE